MDFKLVTSTVLKEFNDNDIEYAVIGGIALGLWEATRSTIDMDFLLLVDDLPKAESILSQFSYRRTFKSDNVVQYVSDLAPYGHLDVLIAFRKVSRGMLKRRIVKETNEGTTTYTLRPEDLIGLKLQAMINNPERTVHELNDMALHVIECFKTTFVGGTSQKRKTGT
jgi:hypothetical protein